MERRTYKSLSQDKQEELTTKMLDWRVIAEKTCQDNIKRMVKARDFENGDQWDLGIKYELEKQGKMCVTVPLIRPQVLQLVGHVVSNPKDIVIENVNGGMKILANVHSRLLKHTIDSSNGIDHMVDWFHRGVSKGDGYIGVFMDKDADPKDGDLRIRVLNEFDCLPDETCNTYDLNGITGMGDGSKYFFWDEPVDKEWAEKMWPEVAEKMTPSMPGWAGRAYSYITQKLTGVAGRDLDGINSRTTYASPEYSKTRYQLTHIWWPEWVDGYYFYQAGKPKSEARVIIDKKEISLAKEAVEKYPGQFELKKSIIKVMHHTKMIGSLFIEDIVDEFDMARAGTALFPVVRFSAIWDEMRRSGIVDDQIGPQEMLNWLRSQVVNLLKLLPNTGWIIDQDIDNYSQVLRSMSGEAAQVIDKQKCGGGVQKIMPSPFPAGLHEISLESKGEIREVSNIRVENPEKDSQEMSGRAILAKQASSQTGISPLLANYDWSLRIFGKLLLTIIQCSNVYSDDEIKAIIEESSLLDPTLVDEARAAVSVMLGVIPEEPEPPNVAKLEGNSPDVIENYGRLYIQQKQVYEAQIQMIDKIAKPMAIQALIDAVRNPIAGRYQATVSLSPYSITARIRDMANMVDLNQILIASQYQPLPENYIIESSDIPKKEKLLKDRGF